MRNEEEASKKACNKLREVFKESMAMPHPIFGKIEYSEDDNVVKVFTDEWTWYMQGWKDTSESSKLSVQVKEEEKKIDLLKRAAEIMKLDGHGQLGSTDYAVEVWLKDYEILTEKGKDK